MTPELDEPADLDSFWSTTLADARTHDLRLERESMWTGLVTVLTFDLSFSGFGGTPVRAWLHLPANVDGHLPAVVEFVGYGGGRGLAHERTLWASAGYAHLVMDIRGQGSAGSVGHTADLWGSGPSYAGFVTRGILDPLDYYYRRVYVDAVRAIEAARACPEVDSAAVVVTGASQGGGIAIAAAALDGDVAAVMPDVPFLCHFRRALAVTERPPYAEVTKYLKVHRDHTEAVFRTLAYHDAALLASRCTSPSLYSVALMDQTCPPSTVFAAFHAHAAADKEIRVYEYNEHEGGQGYQTREQMQWLARHLM